MQKLPIDDVLEDLRNRLKHNKKLILQAPPGAGKSTRVPLALMNEPYLKDKIIILLEPRRVAARMVASQMANLLGEKLGESIGYQVKMDSVQSAQTKVLVVTEAILVRMLQADETLERVGLVIFDEFHERSIHSDLSLALTLEVQELLRDDLKLLIMSATLETTKLNELLGDAPLIKSEGKSYDVEMHYLDVKTQAPSPKNINKELEKIVLQALKNDEGDLLVFLAGAKEIRNLQKSLSQKIDTKVIELLALYGSLSKNEQDKALKKSEKRKIILATNIAQTSLTIEGVRVVVDSGLEKLSRFHYANAMNHLDLSFISKDSATQRAGRAGRLSDGKCYRLWHKHKILSVTTKPEILRSDLSSLCLDLALWGVDGFEELSWLDTPDEEVLQETKEVLYKLEMLDSSHKITPFGRDAIKLGTHPRYAYMILKANEMGYAYEASLLCAMLSEKDIFNNQHKDSDLLSRFTHLLEKDLTSPYINIYLAKEVLKQSDFFFSKLKKIKKITQKNKPYSQEMMAVLLLLAYPDRLAKLRVKNNNKYKLSNSKGALINQEDSLFNEEYLVVANLGAHEKDSIIYSAMGVSLDLLEEFFTHHITKKETLTFNKETQKFDLRERVCFFALELYSKPLSLGNKHDISTLLLELMQKEGLELLTWSKKAQVLQQRVAFVNKHLNSTMPKLDDSSLLKSLDTWLKPFMNGVSSVKALQALDIYPMLLSRLSWSEQEELELLAPRSVQVPSGSKIFIDYTDVEKPVLKVKLQEMFGLERTPKILQGSVALQIQLLSPAMQPIQITYDISSFWENSYSEVRKELRGKYKRHYWPENPYEAVATSKTKKHMMKEQEKN